MLLKLSLFLIYIFGIGLTYILVFIFQRSLLRGKDKKQESFWKKAQGYSQNIEDCQEQS